MLESQIKLILLTKSMLFSLSNKITKVLSKAKINRDWKGNIQQNKLLKHKDNLIYSIDQKQLDNGFIYERSR